VDSSDPRGLSRTIAEAVIHVAACEVSASKLLKNECVTTFTLLFQKLVSECGFTEIFDGSDWKLVHSLRKTSFAMAARLCSISTACAASQAGCLWQVLVLADK